MYLEIFQEILSVVWGQFSFREFLVPAYTPFQGLSYSGSGSRVLHKRTRLGVRFLPSPGLRSSGDQVLCKHTIPGGLCILITSLVPATRFPGCAARAPSHVCHVSPLGNWSMVATLLVDVKHPGSQEDLVRNWKPAHCLVEDTVSGAEIVLCLLALAVTHLPLYLQQGEGLVCSRLALLWYSLNPLFCKWARLCLRLELFMGKFSLSLSLFFFSLWLSHSLGCYLRLAPSDCPQGIQAQSLP